jgi:hypothetical protein
MWLNIVNQPFPINTWRRYWLRGVGFGLFVFLFLFLFQPFQLDLYPTWQLLYTTAVYGVVTGIVIFTGSFLLIRIIAPYINEERWTLGKQILWNTLLMLVIALLNVLATQLMVGVAIPLSFYFTMLKWVFMLGVLPIAFAELLTYNHFLSSHIKSASQMSQLVAKSSLTKVADKKLDLPSFTSDLEFSNNQKPAIDQATKPNKIFVPSSDLVLTGENQHDNLKLSARNLLAVQSLDNYVNIFWDCQGNLKSSMLRNTLTNIADQVNELPYIYRSHRGWLVNTRRVKRVEGNAQGLKLSVELLEQQIPVSRANIAGYREVAEFENLTINN